MKAIEKAMREETKNLAKKYGWADDGRIEVSSGLINPSEFGVKLSTLRKQAQKEGFKTCTWGEELRIYR